MFSIGDFARLGRVSVRMLRHYDALGLLVPARVDPATGYRSYSADQLARLNRIIALRDLGFGLRQIDDALREPVGAEQLQGMLRLRQAELEAEVGRARDRLAAVEARLALIEAETDAQSIEVVLKEIPPIRVARATALAASYEAADIDPVIGPLFARLCARLDDAVIAGPAIACYEPSEDGIAVHAALPVRRDLGTAEGFVVVDLPPILAATAVHHGPMAESDGTVQHLARWIEANGYRSLGFARECTLDAPRDPAQWVTELQEPVVKLANEGPP